MQDLINQLSAATNGKPINQWQPVVITLNGKPRAAYVRPGRITRGDCSYHIQIVKRATIADREGFIKEFYRLQANGKMVMSHYRIVSDQDVHQWSKMHKAGEPITA